MDDRDEMIRALLLNQAEPGWALARQVLCEDPTAQGGPDKAEAMCLRAIAFRKSNMRPAGRIPPAN